MLNGDYEELLPDNEELYIFARKSGGKKIITAVNFTTREVKIPDKIFDGGKKIFGNYSDEKNYFRATEAVIYEF